jgi:sensor domain CHASE-containing protein
VSCALVAVLVVAVVVASSVRPDASLRRDVDRLEREVERLRRRLDEEGED